MALTLRHLPMSRRLRDPAGKGTADISTAMGILSRRAQFASFARSLRVIRTAYSGMSCGVDDPALSPSRRLLAVHGPTSASESARVYGSDVGAYMTPVPFNDMRYLEADAALNFSWPDEPEVDFPEAMAFLERHKALVMTDSIQPKLAPSACPRSPRLSFCCACAVVSVTLLRVRVQFPADIRSRHRREA